MTPRGDVRVSVDGTDVVVAQPELLSDRSARMMFRSILGARPLNGGWRCPRRHGSLSALIVRINTFLKSQGWRVSLVGVADEAVKREMERKRSFDRARESAAALRKGEVGLNLDEVRVALRSFGWDEDSRKLFDHQERGLIHGLTAVNAANFSVPGSGKTSTALAVAATHVVKGTIDLLLVVGPLSCFAPWENEVHAALPEGQLTTTRVRGRPPHRRTVYASASSGQILLISYATAAADRLPLIDLCRRMKVMLVVDESHRVKRFRGGYWAPALMDIARHARVKIILSGTPMPQSGRDLYSQLSVLWPAGELTGPRAGFAARADSDFASILAQVQPFVYRTPKSDLGLPPYAVEYHEVDMTGTQQEIYDLIESNFRRRIEDLATWREKLDALRRGRPIRLLQAAANPDLLNKADHYYRLPSLDSPNPTLMDRLAAYAAHETPAKSKAALALVRQIVAQGQKVVCWSNFVPNLDHFSAMIRSQVDVPCFQVDGRVPAGDEPINDALTMRRANPGDADTRERIIEQFLNVNGPAVLVTNPASCSESISLHSSCHNAIYLDRTYDSALFLQSIDRIHRLGLPASVAVKVHIFMATIEGRDKVDQLVDAALRSKEQAMKQLLDGSELRPLELSPDPQMDAEGDDDDLGDLLRYLLGEEM